MNKLRIIIFDVEHGFCAFVKSPNNYALLIDCGSTDKFSPVKYIIENELYNVQEYNGCKLTKLVVTHPHDDHLSDIQTLKDKLEPAFLKSQDYDWEAIKVGDGKEEYENLDIYSEFKNGYSPSSSPLPDWGMTITHGTFFNTEEAKKINEGDFVNNSSIPTFIEYRGYKIVFPGDLCASGWKEILKKEAFKNAIKGTSFFVTSHHGHSSGYCKEIYDCAGKPYFNIVSAHSRDESVEGAYSKPENARGVTYNGETRYMFSTRSEGSIVIEIPKEGNATFSFENFKDNIEKGYSYDFL